MNIKGKFHLQHFRDGKLLQDLLISNGITDEGKNRILDVMFHGTAATGTWYIGLIDNAGYTGVAAGDTMGSHAGWAENEDYSEGARQAWDENAAASKIMDSNSSSDFSMDDTATIKGFFVTSDSTKGGSSGVLWSTALLASTIDVENGDTLKLTYEIEIT